MTGREYFIFGSTFIMGMFAGAFVFVTIYAPEQAKDETTESANRLDAIVMEGRMYGGCEEQDACGSFRLVDDRTYSYIAYPDADIEKGRLPSDVIESVFETVGTEAFFTATRATSPSNCTSYVDGVDYAYDVSFEGETYTLDTCTTALAQNEALQATLAPIWEFMATPTTTYPTLLEKGLGGVIQDRLEDSRPQE
jgi:hypothetical protein